MSMWSKDWGAGDDGSPVGGADIKNIQDDVNTKVLKLADTQTVTGNKTFSGTTAFSGAVTFASKSPIYCLSVTAAVNMKAASAVATLYTVPTGYTAIITHVIVRSISATLAGGVDFDFTGWRQTVDLSTMTATTDYMVITSDTATPVKYTMCASASTFQITKSTGSTGDATATIECWGYLFI